MNCLCVFNTRVSGSGVCGVVCCVRCWSWVKRTKQSLRQLSLNCSWQSLRPPSGILLQNRTQNIDLSCRLWKNHWKEHLTGKFFVLGKFQRMIALATFGHALIFPRIQLNRPSRRLWALFNYYFYLSFSGGDSSDNGDSGTGVCVIRRLWKVIIGLR